MHRRGFEESWAYGPGYYGFMAPIAPLRAICRSDHDLMRVLPLLLDTTIAAGRVRLAPGDELLLEEFPP